MSDCEGDARPDEILSRAPPRGGAMQEMMPGKILVRAIRIDQTMYTDENVKAARARDKILSMFEESRQREVGLRRDWALPCHTCAGTEHSPATPAPGLGLPLPHLRWDWACCGHISTRTGLKAATSAPGLRCRWFTGLDGRWMSSGKASRLLRCTQSQGPCGRRRLASLSSATPTSQVPAAPLPIL